MPAPRFLARDGLDALLGILKQSGYRCIGPRARDGAIVYDDIDSAADLPAGVHDRQQPGEYRLETDASPRRFAWANGPQALKPLLFRPREPLWSVTRDDAGRLAFVPAHTGPARVAVIGVRACDLAALALQDAHFRDGPHPDPHYAARRAELLLIGVNCTHPAATCFCASTGDGPEITAGHDLVLSELDDGFLVAAGSTCGEDLLLQLPTLEAQPAQLDLARDEIDAGARRQQRTLPGRDLQQTLFARLDHPRWDAVADRCLSCANCTSVCPTCFCYSEQDVPALSGHDSEHVREWDSCFTQGHSYIHGHVVRPGTRERYRQWLTHKLGGWHAQYGRSGCVGCGRCIAWCPAGIDFTEEAHAICAD
jgi:sulfhydrogenase subunit beta (sulfur reductase)